MYIYFDEYLHYSGRISAIFETILLKIFNVIMVMLILQANRKLFTWVNEEILVNDENLFT